MGHVYIVFVFIIIPGFLLSQIRSVNNNNIPKGYIGVGIDLGITSFYGDIDEGAAACGIFKNNFCNTYILKRLY
ncbi:MAG: hypothetical protein R2764_24070 [Bacteroidales bacterium]